MAHKSGHRAAPAIGEPDPRIQLEALTQFVQTAPIGLIQFIADGRVTMLNPMAAQLIDPMARNDLADAYSLLAPIAPDLAAQVAAFGADAGIVTQGRGVEIATPDGSLLAVSFFVQHVGQATYMAAFRDITDTILHERQLTRDGQLFRAIVDSVADYAIYVMDRDGRVTHWNRSIERIGGWLKGDVEGRYIGGFFLHDDVAPASVAALLDAARRDGSVEAEGWRHRRDGSRFWASTTFIALRDEAGNVWGFVGISRDQTERKRTDDELRMLAITDPLTGAYNRRYGHARLAEEMRRYERYRTPLSIIMVDIDRFKSINDRFGHEAGDVALRALVTTCAPMLRATDVFVRWGGEEFLVIMTETSEHAAADAAARICAAVAALYTMLDDGTPIGFTVSIGVAEAQDASMTFLLSRADTALYAAKRAGRNQVIVAGQEPQVAVSSMA